VRKPTSVCNKIALRRQAKHKRGLVLAPELDSIGTGFLSDREGWGRETEEGQKMEYSDSTSLGILGKISPLEMGEMEPSYASSQKRRGGKKKKEIQTSMEVHFHQ